MSMSRPLLDENYAQLNELEGSFDPEGIEQKPYFPIGSVKAQLNFLLGDTLTIIDACIQDQTQKKAMKDLIKHKFWDRSNFMSDMVYGRTAVVGWAKEDEKKESTNILA